MSAELPSHILDQAIHWAVRLYSGTANASDHTACQQWRDADPLHEQAWQQVQAIEQDFLHIPRDRAPLASRTLASAASRRTRGYSRRQTLAMLGATIAVLGGDWLVHRAPWQQMSTYATAVGDRDQLFLHDGSRLHLNTDTSLEVRFSPLGRTIVLHRGEVFIETGHDGSAPMGKRRFWVTTPYARLEALGTQFVVRNLAEATQLHVREGAVAIHLEHTRIVARSGDTYLIRNSRLHPITRVSQAPLDPEAWTRNALIARGMTLTELIMELSRYHHAPLSCDPEVADMRVSGVFQLGETEPALHALRALSNTLPVSLTHKPDGGIHLMAQP